LSVCTSVAIFIYLKAYSWGWLIQRQYMDIFPWKEEGRIEVLASLAPSSQIVDSTLRMRTPWTVKLAKNDSASTSFNILANIYF